MKIGPEALSALFVQAGREEGSQWPPFATWIPDNVMTRLNNLLAEHARAIRKMHKDFEQELRDGYLAAAREAKRKVPASSVTASLTEEKRDELRQRQALLRQRTLESNLAKWTSVSPDAITLTEAFDRDKSLLLTREEALFLTGEVARLTGPAWPREVMGDADIPDLFRRFGEQAVAIFLQRRGDWKRFDEVQQEYVSNFDEEYTAFRKHAIHAGMVSAEEYWTLRPPESLSNDPEERLREQDRRDGERADARRTAESIIWTLMGPWYEESARLAELEQEREREETEAEAALHTARPAPKPAPQPYGVSARGAEFWVCDAVRWLGASEAEVTQASNDGGVDVVTSHFAISVKHYAGTVPVEEIREIFGVAIAMQRSPMLWTSGGLTASAAAFADLAPVPVIQYTVESGELVGLNQGGTVFLQERSPAAES